MLRFNEKEYGRILTNSIENKNKIIKEIQLMDKFEFEYLPEDLILLINNHTILEDCSLIYVGKFYELDLEELHGRLESNNVPFGILLGNHNYEYGYTTLDQKSKKTTIRWLYENGFYDKNDVHSQYGLSYLNN